MGTTADRAWRQRAGVAVLAAALTTGSASAQTQPQTGFLEVCKSRDLSGPHFSGTFTFTISGHPGTVTAPVGACTGTVRLPAGQVSVSEVAQQGFDLTGIAAGPAGRLVSTDIGARTAIVTIVPGDESTQTIVVFQNRPSGVTPIPVEPNPESPPEGGRLKICKIAGPGVDVGTLFAFTALGGWAAIPAGPASQSGYCSIGPVVPLNSEVTFREIVPPGLVVSEIRVAPADRLVGTPDLAGAQVTIRVGTGLNEVTFTNRVPPPPPPPGPDCTRTKGFYKNHEEVVTELLGGPGGTLLIGGHALTADQIHTLFRQAPAGNYLIALRHQLVAARLNQAAGATTPAAIQTAMAAADALIAQQGGPLQGTAQPTTTVVFNGTTYTASQLNDIVTAFNEGRAAAGPGHC
jgi:hypothetical protein